MFDGKDRDILKDVQRAALKRKVKLYLVGGALRDRLLGRRKEHPDFDFTLKRSAIPFGRQLARTFKAGFFVLDKENGACRVVKKTGRGVYTLDFTDFRGATLEEDLLHRDFTVNACAMSLEDIAGRAPCETAFIDPWGGRQDMKARLLKMPHKHAFREDPLRVLRLFSFSSMLGFNIETATLKAAVAARRGLKSVSGERIRDELFKIFAHTDAAEYLEKMDESGILEIVFPEIKKMRGIGQGPYHHLDVWQHTLETIRQFEGVLKENRKDEDVKSYLGVQLSGGRDRAALLKCAALIHDVGKPATMLIEGDRTTFHRHEWVGVRMAQDIGERLKLARDEIQALKTIVAAHLRPGYLSDLETLTARAMFRFFRDCRKETLGVLLMGLADQRATRGPLHTKESHARHERTVRRLLKAYCKKESRVQRPRLADGHDIMAALKIPPSPVVGSILSELEELQAIGKIKNKQEALKAARAIYQDLPVRKKSR